MRYTCLMALALAACSGGGGGGGARFIPPGTGTNPTPTPTTSPTSTPNPYGLPNIKHVIIIVQENRSVDNLFQFLPGANTSGSGANSSGGVVALAPVPLSQPYDINHDHHNGGFVTEYNNGGMNGWNNAEVMCKASCPDPQTAAYAFVPQADVQPYYTMAESYAFADDMFQSNSGPSFPAHQYLISGTSTIADGSPYRASENPGAKLTKNGGCDSPAGVMVETIDPYGNEGNPVRPCFNRTSLMTEMNAAGVSWKYYQSGGGGGFWDAPDAIQPLWSQGLQGNVVNNPAKVLTDISGGTLAQVSWVTPTPAESDHANLTDGTGPDWVASVVNSVGQSKYWQDTAIFITWDDWGGWYDHVSPPQYNSYELGFRVPLIAASTFAKTGYVGHTPYEFGSILKTVEEIFNLPSLGTTDDRATDLSDMFSTSPNHSLHHRFKPIKTKHGRKYFLRQPAGGSPDND